MTGTIEALGLIYTNVEAKDSPTGQRGFQVWQASAGLSAEARKEVSRRVDDYRLPTGAPPEDAAEYCRDSYFKLSDKAGGGFAVARSVPLSGKDKFGRGGRFLAHALVVSAADFAALHHDPFALFDAAPFLSGEPEQLAKDHPEWQKGVLPASTLTPAVTAGDGLPGEVRAQFAGHVDREAAQRKTVVVVGLPAAVAGVLRAVYRGLPPALRAASEFDTMSAGSSLTQVPCAFAGCPSAAALKVWAFRRFVTFTPPGSFTPLSELQKPERPLCAALPGTPAWAEATDCVRAAAWAVAAALAAGRLGDAAAALRGGGGREAEELVTAAPTFVTTLDALKRDWLARCPAAVAAVPGVRDRLERELGGILAEVLGRLQGELPRAELTAIVLERVALKSHRGAEGDWGHIQDWNGKGHGDGSFGRRLDWVLSRLRGRGAAELLGVLSGEVSEDSEWLRKWVRAILKHDGHTATTLLDRLAHELDDDAVGADAIHDAALYLHCVLSEPEDLMRDLRFRHACRAGTLGELLTGGDLPEVGECLGYLRQRAALGWADLDAAVAFVGAFVYPRTDLDAKLVEQLCQQNGGEYSLNPFGQKALRTLFPSARPEPLRPRGFGDMVSRPLEAFIDRLKTTRGRPLDAKRLQEGVEALKGSASLFQEAVEHVAPKLTRESWGEPPRPEHPLEAALMGFRLKWLLPESADSYLKGLLEVVLRAAAPKLDRDRPPAAESFGGEAENFAWFLSRL